MASSSSATHPDVHYVACSDVGMKRPMNQDAFVIVLAQQEDIEAGHRFVVADGMGAHAAGELASQMAVDTVASRYAESGLPPRAAIEDALKHANAAIFERGQADTQLYNMGTTCSALVLLREGALVAHVGDSRVYRCRDEQIQQLTFDHSLVWEMRAAGQFRDDVPNSAIPRNVITRCLGPHPDVEVDVEGLFSIQRNDTFVLCSDGLTGRISDHEIGVIATQLQPNDAAEFLVNLANLRGGSDNITVVIARVVSDALNTPGEVQEKQSSRHETHPGWWFAAGGGLVLALICYQFGQYVPGTLGLLLFLIAICGAAVQWVKRRSPTATSGLVSPYVTSPSTEDDDFHLGIATTFRDVLETIARDGEGYDELERDVTALGDDRSDLVGGTPLCARLANIAGRLRVRI